MKTRYSKQVKTLFQLFHENGYQLYLVGGCVRDFLLKKPIHDIDMTTDATPSQMEEMAKKASIRCIPTGRKHGTITFLLDDTPFEITTFRKESEYVDHRRPNKISFSTRLEYDVIRRDFTINALCMDEERILDFVDGQSDLKNGIIRCVGNPKERFTEDALRILRCARFAFTLHFSIEENTYAAMKECAPLLKHISNERIREELCKMLMSDQEDILLLLKNCGILDVILPEYQMTYDLPQETPYHIYDVFHHMNAVLNQSIHAPLNIKLALLLHDLEKKNFKTIDEHGIAHFKQHAHASAVLAKSILKRLKFDNKIIQEVYTYIDYHDYYLTPKPKVIRKLLYKLNGNFALAYAIMEVQKYDNMGKNPEIMKEKNEIIDEAVLLMKEMEKRKECFCIKDLRISGKDLLKLGFKGKEIKETLDYLLLQILNQQEKNNYEELLKYAGGIKHETIYHK